MAKAYFEPTLVTGVSTWKIFMKFKDYCHVCMRHPEKFNRKTFLSVSQNNYVNKVPSLAHLFSRTLADPTVNPLLKVILDARQRSSPLS